MGTQIIEKLKFVGSLIWSKLIILLWRRRWQPTSVPLSGKSHGQRSLGGCSAWGRKESDTTERLHFHFSLSCIGEGNGNPLQCSCLENPRDGRAWWAAIYGVSQSQTRLKWLSSSSSINSTKCSLWDRMCWWRCCPCVEVGSVWKPLYCLLNFLCTWNCSKNVYFLKKRKLQWL